MRTWLGIDFIFGVVPFLLFHFLFRWLWRRCCAPRYDYWVTLIDELLFLFLVVDPSYGLWLLHLDGLGNGFGNWGLDVVIWGWCRFTESAFTHSLEHIRLRSVPINLQCVGIRNALSISFIQRPADDAYRIWCKEDYTSIWPLAYREFSISVEGQWLTSFVCEFLLDLARLDVIVFMVCSQLCIFVRCRGIRLALDRLSRGFGIPWDRDSWQPLLAANLVLLSDWLSLGFDFLGFGVGHGVFASFCLKVIII
jgi:hypothetical protein